MGALGIDVANVNNAANNVAKTTVNIDKNGEWQSALMTVAVASAAFQASLALYDRYISKDDAKLLQKLGMEDCGGINRMSSVTEGCYRDYLSKAIHRMIMSPNYNTFYNRFQECFSHRKEQSCSFWGEDVFVT